MSLPMTRVDSQVTPPTPRPDGATAAGEPAVEDAPGWPRACHIRLLPCAGRCLTRPMDRYHAATYGDCIAEVYDGVYSLASADERSHCSRISPTEVRSSSWGLARVGWLCSSRHWVWTSQVSTPRPKSSRRFGRNQTATG